MADSIVQGLDSEILALSNRINTLNDRISQWPKAIGYAKAVQMGLASGSFNSSAVKQNYDYLQDWNNKYLDTHPTQVYLSAAPPSASDSESAKWANVVSGLNALQATDNEELAQKTAKKAEKYKEKADYLKSLPTAEADAQAAEAQAEAEKAKAEAEKAKTEAAKVTSQAGLDSKKLAMQATTKYLIIGGIALVVIAIVVIVVRKKYAA